MKRMYPEISKTPVSTTPSGRDRRCAALLHETLSQRRVLTAPYSENKWSNTFRVMRQVGEVSSKEMVQVLKWYKRFYDNKYTPKTYSADSFRVKYQDIKRAMERQQREECPELDQDAKRILASLDMLIWPKIEKDQLKNVVARSAHNLKLAASLLRLKKNHSQFRARHRDRSDDMERVIGRILNEVFGQTSHTLTNYFTKIWKSVVRWENWNGRIEIYSIDTKEVKNAIHQIVSATFGTRDTGDDAMNFVYEMLASKDYR